MRNIIYKCDKAKTIYNFETETGDFSTRGYRFLDLSIQLKIPVGRCRCGSIAYFRPPPHHHLRTQLPSIGCVRPPDRAACRLKSRSAMWRSAARRSPQIRRLLSSSAPQAGAGAAVPGPCIVHKRGNDILHDPWYNKVGSQPIRSRGFPSSPISRLRAGSDAVSS